VGDDGGNNDDVGKRSCGPGSAESKVDVKCRKGTAARSTSSCSDLFGVVRM